jgi:hypothetical protein
VSVDSIQLTQNTEISSATVGDIRRGQRHDKQLLKVKLLRGVRLKTLRMFIQYEGKPIHKDKSIPHICGHKYMHAYTHHTQIHPRTHMYI